MSIVKAALTNIQVGAETKLLTAQPSSAINTAKAAKNNFSLSAIFAL
jgi:hypothetical protein